MNDLKEDTNFELFEALAEEAMISFVVFKEDNEVVHECIYTNKLANSTLELHSLSEGEGLQIESLYPSEQNENFKVFAPEILQHEGLYQELLATRANGAKFVMTLAVKRLKINESNYLLLMIQDVTFQKKLQKELTVKQAEIQKAYQELLEQNKQLKDLDIAKNRFIALTTHELRTPLSAMLGSSELLRDKLYDNEEQMNEFIEMIYEQGLHLMELVNDILDFAKIQNGKMDFFIGQKDLRELAEDVIEQLETVAEHSNVDLKMDISKQEYLCYYDDVRLTQVVNNIISNAIKYNKKDGDVLVTLEDDGDFLKLVIKDSGKGIPQELQSKVFNEFDTLGKVSNHQKGTGLGMPISKRLIEGMGGTIDFTSEEGVGSCFWITIPKNKVLSDEQYRDRTDSFDLAG